MSKVKVRQSVEILNVLLYVDFVLTIVKQPIIFSHHCETASYLLSLQKNNQLPSLVIVKQPITFSHQCNSTNYFLSPL